MKKRFSGKKLQVVKQKEEDAIDTEEDEESIDLTIKSDEEDGETEINAEDIDIDAIINENKKLYEENERYVKDLQLLKNRCEGLDNYIAKLELREKSILKDKNDLTQQVLTLTQLKPVDKKNNKK